MGRIQTVKKPNTRKCEICNKINSDWRDVRDKKYSNLFAHRLCLFKMGHYGFTPEQYAKWKREIYKVRKKVLERDNHLCVKCKNKCHNCKRDLREKGKIKLNVHHKISVIKGGSNNMRNLITVCQFCNRMLDSKREFKLK